MNTTDNASIEYEDGVPAVFENLHQLYLLEPFPETKVPSEPLNQFWQRSVFHRQGLLSLGTVLDGSQGMSLDKYVFEHVNNVDPLTVSSLFILQKQIGDVFTSKMMPQLKEFYLE